MTMPSKDNPELIDYNENNLRENDRQFFGFFPLTLGTLAAASLFNNFGCQPVSFHHHWRDYYTCSPKYVCKPVPYYP